MQQTGGCPSVSAGIGDGAVEIEGNQTIPGTGGGPSGGGATGGSAPEEPDVCEMPFGDRCMALGPERGTPTDPADATPAVTLADLASFRPAAGGNHMEPDGWVVAGLDANFYSTGGVQVVDGTLLGQPASVRFTPVRWTWSYGDGSTATRSTPGGTWQSQGIREFDPTPTSHVYRAYGTYYVDLVIGYAPDYRFAGRDWTRIPGVLDRAANQLVITAGDAKTVLVERECTRNPRGPGC